MSRTSASHSRRAPARRGLALAAAAAAIASLAVERTTAGAASPITLRTIDVDGSFGDWDAVLASLAQTTKDGDGSSAAIKADCGLYSTDRDCPLTGGAGNDILTFAWTYDASNVYLYIERFGSSSNGVDFLFVADVNRDRRLTAQGDVVIHANWFGSTGNVTTNRWDYLPADSASGDPIVCDPAPPATACANAAGVPAAPPGFVDGYKLPGSNVGKVACAGCVAKGGADGTRMELAVPWSVFGATPDQPFYWHVVTSNNDSLLSAVDNVGAPDGRLGSFVQRGVSLGPDRSGAALSPGEVSYVHALVNDGNDQDLFDLAATSTQAARLDLIDGGTVVATDLEGDGVWDSVLGGNDANGNGRPDVTLAPAGARDLTVRITMPAGRSGQDVMRLTATSAGDPAVQATATDRTHVGTPAFLPQEREGWTVAAQPLPFDQTLQNGQIAPDTYALHPDAGCPGYRVELALDDSGSPGAVVASDADGDGSWDSVEPSADTDLDGAPDLGAVGGGASIVFHLLVTPPAGTPSATTCSLRLEATSPTTGATASALHAVHVADPVTFSPSYRGAVAGSADTADTRISTGAAVFFPATIRNAEATARAYGLSISQTGGSGAATPRVWTDPNGDGNPSDGVVIAQTSALAPFGGRQDVVVEVGAGATPTGTFLVTTATATALLGGASASQVSEALVGNLGVYADPLFTDASGSFAPCSTVHVEARGLLPGDVGTYALEWVPPSGPPPAGVSPWPTTARGAASSSLALADGAAQGEWRARLLESGGEKDAVSFWVELSGSVPSLVTDRLRYAAGEDVVVSASVRNDGAAALAGTSLVYTGAVTRTRAGVTVAPGAAVSDGFTFTLPADATPGTRALELGWRLSCAGAPFLTRGTTFDVAPPPPSIAAPAEGALLPSTTPTIQGTARPGAEVVVSVSDPLGPIASPALPVDGSGTWTWTVPAATPLSEGDHVATARQTEGGVPSDASAGTSFRVDTVPPAAPTISSPADGALRNVSSLPVAGLALDPEAVAVEILVDGAVAASASVVAGEFAASVAVADGPRVLAARALDPAGNVSAPSGLVIVTIDTVPPAQPSLALGVASPTRAQPVPVTGLAEPLAQVELREGATTLATVAADPAGAFSASLALAEGPRVLVAFAVDAAGNAGPDSDPLVFEVDRTAPPIPAIASPPEGALLGAAAAPGGSVAIAGAAEAGATVELEVSGVTQPAVIAGPGDGFAAAVALADGAHQVRARAVDAAGNASAWSTPVAFSLDTAAPGQPFLSSPADGAATGSATVRIDGAVDTDAASVELLEGGVPVAVAVPAAGAVSYELVRPEGVYSWSLVAHDAAGNVSPASNEATVTVDRTPPPSASIDSPADGATVPGSGGVLFSGGAEAGATVRVSVDGGAPVLAPVAADGSWSVTVPMGDGAHAAAVSVVDRAGNASAEATRSFVSDSVPPGLPAIASPADGAATNAAPVVVSGTAEAGARVEVLVGGAVAGTVLADPGGSFSLPVALAEGAFVVTARAVDEAGNASAESAASSVTVDRTAPAAPSFDAPAPGASVAPGAVRFEGHAEPGARVTVEAAGATVTATAATDGSWEASIELAAGPHVATATATDAAGNASEAAQLSVVAYADDGASGGGGCGCGAGSGGASSVLALLAALSLAPAGRRRRRGG